jgi:hypothetical protein
MIPSRPLNIGEIITETIGMSWRTFIKVFVVAAILSGISTFLYVWGITDIINRTYIVLEKNYPLDSVSVSNYREGMLREIDEENPLFYTIYIKQYLRNVNVDIKKEIERSADSITQVSPSADTLHAPSQFDNVQSHDSRDYFDETASFFIDNSEALFGIFDGIFFSTLVSVLVSLILGTFVLDICIRYFEQRKLNIIAALVATLRRNAWMSILMYLLMVFVLLFGFGAMLSIAVFMPTGLEILLVMFAFFMLILTGVRLVFAQAALVSEELGPWEALHRSWQLTKGHFWRIVGISIVVGLILIVMEAIVQAIAGIFDTRQGTMIIGLISGEHTNVKAAFEELISLIQVSSIQSVAVGVLFITFIPSFLTVFYYDLRTRKDGPLTYPEEQAAPPTSGALQS